MIRNLRRRASTSGQNPVNHVDPDFFTRDHEGLTVLPETPAPPEPTNNRPLNYWLLLLVITGGVALGSLLADGVRLTVSAISLAIAADIAEEKLREAREQADAQRQQDEQLLQERAEQDAIQAAAEARATQAQHQAEAAARQQRRNDRTGKQLAQTCADWQRAQQDFDSETTRREVARHCVRYERYVQTGFVLP